MIRPCDECGKTWDEACAEAEAKGAESTGWMNQFGPHGETKSLCGPCNRKQTAAFLAGRG